jgi:hypothetical protein
VTTRLIQHRSGLLPLPYLTNTSSATSAVRAGAIVLLPKALDAFLNPRVDRINKPHTSPLRPPLDAAPPPFAGGAFDRLPGPVDAAGLSRPAKLHDDARAADHLAEGAET